jgi:hypothetical protein
LDILLSIYNSYFFRILKVKKNLDSGCITRADIFINPLFELIDCSPVIVGDYKRCPVLIAETNLDEFSALPICCNASNFFRATLLLASDSDSQ